MKAENYSVFDTGMVKGISARNTARFIRKYGTPQVRIKHPHKYKNRWKSSIKAKTT